MQLLTPPEEESLTFSRALKTAKSEQQTKNQQSDFLPIESKFQDEANVCQRSNITLKQIFNQFLQNNGQREYIINLGQKNSRKINTNRNKFDVWINKMCKSSPQVSNKMNLRRLIKSQEETQTSQRLKQQIKRNIKTLIENKKNIEQKEEEFGKKDNFLSSKRMTYEENKYSFGQENEDRSISIKAFEQISQISNNNNQRTIKSSIIISVVDREQTTAKKQPQNKPQQEDKENINIQNIEQDKKKEQLQKQIPPKFLKFSKQVKFKSRKNEQKKLVQQR